MQHTFFIVFKIRSPCNFPVISIQIFKVCVIASPKYILWFFYNRSSCSSNQFNDLLPRQHFYVPRYMLMEIPPNPFPICGGLSPFISFANNSKGNNSNFVPGVSKKHNIIHCLFGNPFYNLNHPGKILFAFSILLTPTPIQVILFI